MRIALAQYALDQDPDVNVAKALDLLRQAKTSGAQFIFYPELCLSPFFPQFPARDVSRYALSIEHGSVQSLREACRKLQIAASPNLYLQERGRRFDASLMIGADGNLLGISKMVHIAQVPGFYEQDYYTPSDTGFKVYDTPLGKIGVVICFDRHYPESVRTCVLRGAQLVIIPTANTMAEPRELFRSEVCAAAFQNGVFIAMCNRVGREGDVTFCGESLVVGPEGDVLAQSGETEDLLIADLELSQVAIARQKRPYLALRNPEVYER